LLPVSTETIIKNKLQIL
jgi:hypothetical protein